MLIKTRTVVATEYGVCRKTLRKRMKAMPYEFPDTSLGSPWLKLIYEEMGYPESVNEEDFVKVRVPRLYRHLFEQNPGFLKKQTD